MTSSCDPSTMDICGDTPEPTCEICRSTETILCQGCRSSHYCSQECQRMAWPKHRLLCRSFGDFAAFRRPGPNFRRAIYFPAYNPVPRFTWLEFERRYDDAGGYLDVPLSGDLLGKDRPATEFKSATEVHSHSDIDCVYRYLPHTIVLQFRDAVSGDGCDINAAVRQIYDGDVDISENRRGPILAFGLKGIDDPWESDDLDTTDFSHICDGIAGAFRTTPTDFRRERAVRPAAKSTRPDDDFVVGVRVNCEGDEQCNSRPKYESVRIPKTHSIFDNDESPPIPEQLGLPLLVTKLPHDRCWVTYATGESNPLVGTYNPELEDLYVELDPTAPKHGCVYSRRMLAIDGWEPHGHEYGPGSVMLVRKDGKPLFPEHVEAMSEFCQEKVKPVLFPEICNHNDGVQADQGAVLREATKDKFAGFFRTWTVHTGKTAMSPYEVDRLDADWTDEGVSFSLDGMSP